MTQSDEYEFAATSGRACGSISSNIGSSFSNGDGRLDYFNDWYWPS